MKLYDKRNVDFDEVLNVFNKEHRDESGKHLKWERKILKHVNKKFGLWIYTKISIQDIDEIILPYHTGLGCGNGSGDITSPAGDSLGEANKIILNNNAEKIKKISHVCYEKIMFQKYKIEKGESPGIFFFSKGPIYIGSSYKSLNKKHEDKIVHLDGLHRLFALKLVKNPPKFIECYICIKK